LSPTSATSPVAEPDRIKFRFRDNPLGIDQHCARQRGGLIGGPLLILGHYTAKCARIPPVVLSQAPSEFDGTLEELYEKHILPVMPSVEAVQHIHGHLKRIYEAGVSTPLIRYERKEQIGTVQPMTDGTNIRWTDNAPGWAMHRAAFEKTRWNSQQFDAFIQSLPVRMFDAPRPSIRDAGYYVAHLLRVKDSAASAVDLSSDDRLVRFMRNVHPVNHFYVANRPRGTGQRYGEDPTVIAFITAQYEKRYSGMWQQFIAMMRGESLRGQAGAGATRVTFRVGDERSIEMVSGVETIVAESHNVSATAGMCIPITEAELCPLFRRWRGDDKKGRYRHNGAVRLLESPLNIRLEWRRSPASPTKLVGCYRLDLDALLAQGYIRQDITPGEVRLQFVHEGDAIYIQSHGWRRLRVACFT